MTKGKTKGNIIPINKNTIYIVVGVIVALLLLIIIGKKISNGKAPNTLKYTFDENKPILVTNKGLYQLINRNGKKLSKEAYDYIVDSTGKYIVAEKDGKYYIIDKNGKEKIVSDTAISYDSTNDVYVANEKLYNSNLKQISPNKVKVTNSGFGFFRFISEDGKEAGVINSKGKITYRQKVNQGSTFYIYIGEKNENLKDVYCAISESNLNYGIINCNTGKVIKEMGNKIVSAAGNNVFYVGEDDTPGSKIIYISNNKIVFETEEKVGFHYHSVGYIDYKEGETTKYFNTKTNKKMDEIPVEMQSNVVKTEFEQETGYSRISCTRKYGVISKNDVIIPCEYEKISFLPYKLYQYLQTLGKEYALVTNNQKTEVLSLKTGKSVHTFNTETVPNASSNSPIIYYYEKSNSIVVYNLKTNKTTTLKADYIDTYGNYIRIHKDKKIVYYNLDFKKIYETDDK